MIFRSPCPDIAIPNVSLTDFVLRTADALKEQAALIDGATGRTLSYGQLAGAIRRAAASLVRRGFRNGDVFAIHAPNLPEYAVAFHAVSAAGGVSTTVNPLATRSELHAQLWDSRASYLLTMPSLLPMALKAARGSKIGEVFVLDGGDGATSFETLLEGDGDGLSVEIDPRRDLVALPYLASTLRFTFARGVMLTHRNMVANILQIAAVSGNEREVVMTVLPFFHSAGLTVLNLSLYLGATIVIMPRFDLDRFLDSLQRYKVTRAYLGSTVVAALAKHPVVNNYDLSQLKTVVSDARVDTFVERALADRLGCRVRQGYGLTETSPVVAITPDDSLDVPQGSSGLCVPNTEVRVVDVAAGTELGPTKKGEILIRGPQVMKGYLDRPESTARAIDKDGWLHTGDIGYLDEDAYVYIVERPKITYEVNPWDLEEILVTHPAIADAAVIPSPGKEGGEVPKALVVLKQPISPEEIVSFVAERVSWHNRVRLVEVVDEIPRTRKGPNRRELIARDRTLHSQEAKT